MMDYENDLKIDEQALDVEWLNQPERMFKYCQHVAEMHMQMDLAKEELDYVKAQLDKDIRSNPAKFEVKEKPTEGSILATVQLSPKYQDASRAYIKSRYDYDIAKGAVAAFENRKSALENLVKLQGQSYFAGPAIPHNLTQLREQKDSNAQTKVKLVRRS